MNTVKRGVLLAEIHNYESALEDLFSILSNPRHDIDKDLEIKTHIGNIYNHMGILAYKQNDLKEAISKFTLAINYNPYEPEIFKNRAGNYYKNIKIIN